MTQPWPTLLRPATTPSVRGLAHRLRGLAVLVTGLAASAFGPSPVADQRVPPAEARPPAVRPHADGAREVGELPWRAPLLAPRLLVPFGVGPLPWSPGHRGVDLASATPAVVAPAGGTVSFSGVVAGAPVVVISHPDGSRSTLLPVRSTLARGAQVRAGQDVGVVAVAPLAPAVRHVECPAGLHCLHWGVIRGEVYVDPWHLLLQPAVVRLVPDWAGSVS